MGASLLAFANPRIRAYARPLMADTLGFIHLRWAKINKNNLDYRPATWKGRKSTLAQVSQPG